jgi:hypothetical protein
MIIFLYTDQNYEYQARNTIESLRGKLTDDIKIVYYTIGFTSDFEFPNLYKIQYPIKPEYPKMNFYKAELSLATMNIFPNEHYIYTDSDVIFSRRFDADKLRHELPYPLASFGPHEYVFTWTINESGDVVKYNEAELMKYFNVADRTQRYVFSCFYSFNSMCRDFFEEFMSICSNQYLLKQDNGLKYFPFTDEGAFNICLWKRNATENLGYLFLNTHLAETIRLVEESYIHEQKLDKAIDTSGLGWDYVHDSSKIMFYHGVKDDVEAKQALNYVKNQSHKISWLKIDNLLNNI